jgi:hypothetical protein
MKSIKTKLRVLSTDSAGYDSPMKINIKKIFSNHNNIYRLINALVIRSNLSNIRTTSFHKDQIDLIHNWRLK